MRRAGGISKILRQKVIDRSKTRILAFINIVGNGMRGGKFENDLTDMQAKPTAEMAMKYKDTIIGVKTAHYTGPEWTPVEQAVEAGTIAKIPVMVDFGTNRKERPMSRTGDEETAPGRHLHALLFGTCATNWSTGK